LIKKGEDTQSTFPCLKFILLIQKILNKAGCVCPGQVINSHSICLKAMLVKLAFRYTPFQRQAHDVSVLFGGNTVIAISIIATVVTASLKIAVVFVIILPKAGSLTAAFVKVQTYTKQSGTLFACCLGVGASFLKIWISFKTTFVTKHNNTSFNHINLLLRLLLF
jgi:hypothetical protein